MMVPQSQPPEASVGRAGSSRDTWFHHPSQALPLTATVPRLPNGMERKAGRAQRSVLDLVVATCTAALAGAMSVVPPDPRRVAGVVPSASRPCPDALCTGESRRRQSTKERRAACQSLISDLSGVESSPAATLLSLPRTRRGSCEATVSGTASGVVHLRHPRLVSGAMRA